MNTKISLIFGAAVFCLVVCQAAAQEGGEGVQADSKFFLGGLLNNGFNGYNNYRPGFNHYNNFGYNGYRPGRPGYNNYRPGYNNFRPGYNNFNNFGYNGYRPFGFRSANEDSTNQV
ncbi:probable serine/threonine-protein kinase clkA [Eurytemora carolleeae]|uniref:probable serine/threonine-protein kinase clkA n=1 Tax=Eurytemora carolleeae TaxID=1294199 RepID=UPI000C774090|nr:probable serine/threonine-protein kinase clkA [Eurytemora carolleeae]|eukprot:XP_023332973.1 probable serine/threonine-protein kinase clkA [Eurytemora affinis]